jgi:hypothetical protein
LNVPSGALSTTTNVTFATYSDLGVGNSMAASTVSPNVGISIDPSALTTNASFTVNLPEQASANPALPPFAELVSNQTLLVVSQSFDPVSQTAAVTLNPADLATVRPALVSRSPGGSPFFLRIRLPQVPHIPAPAVTLYHFEGIQTFGDPDGGDASPYSKAHDFLKNWKYHTQGSWGSHRVALLVHGVRNDLSNMTELAYYLKNLKDVNGNTFYDGGVFGCDVTWQAHIQGNGALVAALISKFMAPSTSLDMFAHSQGGLVSRWAIEDVLPTLNPALTVNRLFTLSSPHLGMPTSVIEDFVDMVPGAVGGLGVLEAFYPGLTDCEDDSDFIAALNAPALTKTSYLSLSGTDFGDYLYGFGSVAHFLEHDNCDGFIPVTSANAVGIRDRAKTWTILPSYPLTHSMIRGEFAGKPLNLDVTGTARLTDYILGSNLTVGVH